MASIVVITQFYSETSDSIGPGALSNFFLGKYHHPVVVERIFIFLDMKASTTIAENLGHVRYFDLLKDNFFDLSVAVIDYGGTIYQYAGDEMINRNCSRRIQKTIVIVAVGRPIGKLHFHGRLTK